ncbi:MAG: beta-lactamase family protein [Verrucomicrobia bacterium]|nr:beta-lactamase family protein [Verrucomicrobiota bacterium]
MTRRKYLLLVALLLAAVRFARADAVDDLVKAEMGKQQIPGLALAVVKDGMLAKAAGYGLANVEEKTPVLPDTVFRIASVGKQFIATGIMLLVEEGKLGLEDRLDKLIKDVPAAWAPLTVRQLLSHTSGLVRESPGYVPILRQPDINVIRAAYSLPLQFTPGEKYQYSNVGYFTLAEIIQRKGGQPWPEFISARIFKPAQLNATATTDKPPKGPRATGYAGKDGRWTPVVDALAVRPSGAFHSTVLDLARWDMLLDGDKVLKAASREEMWKPTRLNDGKLHNYGLAWTVGTKLGRPVIHHGGSQSGFRTEFMRFPKDRVTVIVLANSDEAKPALFAEQVAAAFLSPPPAVGKK